MKKIMALFVVMLIVTLSIIPSFAGEYQQPGQIKTADDSGSVRPLFTYVFTCLFSFTISSSGNATMEASLVPKDNNAIDKVEVTFVITDSSDNVIYNKTHTAAWSSLRAEYRLSKDYQLQQKGAYFLNVTMKCYKNEKLLETVNCGSKLASY